MALLLALLGASTLCVADCVTQPNVPPCHKQSQSKSCDHVQLSAYTQALCAPAMDMPMIGTPAPAMAAWAVFASEAAPADIAPPVFSILRL